MDVVVDANILVAALLKDSITRELIGKIENLYTPQSTLEKLNKHKEFILKKANISPEKFSAILENLTYFVKVIPDDTLDQYREESCSIMEHIDREDVIYIAAALSKNASIWSEDKHFEQQNKVRVLKTADILKLL